MKTYHELRNQLQQLQAKLEEVTQRERANVIADIQNKMQEYGIELSDLGPVRRRSAKTAAAQTKGARKPARRTTKKAQKPSAAMQEVRYRDPASGATWSGRGRAPRWIAGKDREPFTVTH